MRQDGGWCVQNITEKFITLFYPSPLSMNGFKVGGEIDLYIARVSGWSQNKVTNIRLVSKKGLKNE